MLQRFVAANAVNIKTLIGRLTPGMGSAPDTAAATLASLRRLNPHLGDRERIPAGTVLILPETVVLPGRGGDGEEASAGESETVGRADLEQFAGLVRQAARSSAERVGAGHAALAAQQKEVTAALRSTAVKRQIEADADLRKQVEEADTVFKADQQRAKETQQTLAALQEDVEAELAVLGKLFG